MPGMIKIGATRRDPAERLREANESDTWRPPHAYGVAGAAEVEDPFAAERAIHALLAARRVNSRHEFFEITQHDARVILGLLTPTLVRIAETAANENGPEPAPRAHAHSDAEKLRQWIEGTYTHVPLKEKHSGTKLDALYSAYTSAVPPVHTRALGRNRFAKMLESVYPGIGAHRGINGARGIYLLRR